MNKKTHTNALSELEMEQLRSNPYVISVTSVTVRFTEEFKKYAYEQKMKGVPVTETMRCCGINPKVLGESRIEGFSYTLNKIARQKCGFTDGRSSKCHGSPDTPEETVD